MLAAGDKQPAETARCVQDEAPALPPSEATRLSTAAKRREYLRRLGPTGLLGLVWTACPAIAGTLLLVYLGTVSEWLDARGALGVLIYIAVFVVSAGLGFLPTYAQAIVGGWVFGFWFGFPAALTGFVGGSLVGYFVARTVSRDRVEELIEQNRRAQAVRDALIGHGFWKTLLIVTLLRVPPNSPFALTNLAMAATGVRIVPYFFGTLFGMAPRTGVAVLFAAAASAESRDIQEFIKQGPGLAVFIGGAVVMMIVLGVIGVIANRALERVSEREPPSRGGAPPT